MHRNGRRFYNLTWEGRATGLTLVDVMKNGQDACACCPSGASDRRRLRRATPKLRCLLRCASVGVLEADDVVLAEVRARLDLDQFERDLAGVRQTVGRAERDVGRLVLGQHDLLVAVRDHRRALHDDPVFGAMVVHLQAQLCARVHDDALDLEAIALVDAFVRAPWAHDAAVRDRFVAAGRVQPFDDFLDVLGFVTMRDEHGVGGFHDHDVVEAEGGDHPVFGADVRVLYRVGEDVADQRVALFVSFCNVSKRAPRSDVVPAEVGCRDDGGAFGFLHHRVVDRDVRAGGEHVCVEADEVVVALGGFEREFCLAGDFRCMAMQFLHVRGCLQHEHAAVPVVVAVAEEAFGRRCVGLFDECIDLVDLLAVRDGLAATDIAEAGMRFRRRDTERDEVLVCCDRRCLCGCGNECRLVEDHVVGRQYQ